MLRELGDRPPDLLHGLVLDHVAGWILILAIGVIIRNHAHLRLPQVLPGALSTT